MGSCFLSVVLVAVALLDLKVPNDDGDGNENSKKAISLY